MVGLLILLSLLAGIGIGIWVVIQGIGAGSGKLIAAGLMAVMGSVSIILMIIGEGRRIINE